MASPSAELVHYVTHDLASGLSIVQSLAWLCIQEKYVMAPSYRDLRVWQNAMELVVSVYHETQDFPKEELYGLRSQMRRAAVSIPSNIAEGKGRSTDRDRALFFCHARGSLLELETQILIAQRLNYLTPTHAEALVKASTELGRMLNALIQSIRIPEASRRLAVLTSEV